jgi:hypothetical protein
MKLNEDTNIKGCLGNFDEAYRWLDKVNADKNEFNEPFWSFDCGLKLNFDGQILGVFSRFYPPTKWYGMKWDGTVSIKLLGETINKESFECETIDELKKAVEKFVKEYIERLSAFLNIQQTTVIVDEKNENNSKKE